MLDAIGGGSLAPDLANRPGTEMTHETRARSAT